MSKIIAEGGFNTGRQYTAAGQRIYWWVDDDGTVTFYDLDRLIIGVMDRQEYPQYLNPQILMAMYDHGEYHMGCQPARVPEGFQFERIRM